MYGVASRPAYVQPAIRQRRLTHKPALSRRKDRPIWSRCARWLWQQGRARFNRAPKAPAAPKAPSIRQVDSQPGEQGLDLDHAQFASSRASHVLTSSTGKVMAGTVAKIRRSRTMIVEDWSDELEVNDLD